METIGLVIVDDHPLFREGVRNVINAEPDLKVRRRTAHQAVELFESKLAALIDVNLPGLNGIQVTRQIVSERLSTRSSCSRPTRWRSSMLSRGGGVLFRTSRLALIRHPPGVTRLFGRVRPAGLGLAVARCGSAATPTP
jgi:hypothetical protein